MNVLLHEVGVHADQVDGQRFCDEFNLDVDGFGNDPADDVFTCASDQLAVKQTGEITVKPLVARDEFV